MCSPRYFDVSYDINPWMTGNINRVKKTQAHAQWLAYRNQLAAVVEVLEVEPQSQLPDLVFTANAGFVYDDQVIISRFFYPQRQQEEQVFRNWFESQNYQIKELAWYFEGQGDLLIDDQERFWMGSGFRTVPEAAPEIENIVENKVNLLELVDPRWYHLDTAFCPLPDSGILWYPRAFSPASRKLIEKSFDTQIRVSSHWAKKFVCNSVVIGRNIFMPAAGEISEKLTDLGFQVHSLNFSEFQLGGGAARCLVLNL